ncbi:hypothetical protein BO94DRAFT_589411 [Aspergillus sclerotioniger CBS 115572]|uniref:Homeodomain-like protein n=1 Tax=Aspergillus sclerotioniger CBS 115572 TaxID=1450535 RepID=A0A317VLR1_9EURO|nr:hypothetical protein BO94DRAFT_589411 [Aspergillus sclerotioniger CBS 115572]PWY73878.1 hypothetical protein BO94DRAFT_589411 [Aspergillus sclerotioniger CBS 115572]
MAKTSRRWTPSEDEKLRLLVQRYGDQRGHNSKWYEISQGLPGRTNKDCRKRWFHSLDPRLRKGRWTADEDRTLVAAYERLGPAWKEIALLIPGRKDDQCAKRYNDILCPLAKARLRAWTPEEDQLLQEKVAELGHAWSTISTFLHGRPPLTCRNRWRKLSRSIDCMSSSSSSSSSPEREESTPILTTSFEDESLFTAMTTGWDWESPIPDINPSDPLNLHGSMDVPIMDEFPLSDAMALPTPEDSVPSLLPESVEAVPGPSGVVYHIHHHHHYHFNSSV